MNITIRPLSPELKEDYLSFFESIEFKEHPHWANCYCYSYHFTGYAGEWQNEKNRSCVSAMIDEGSLKGYLAYKEDRVLGWCNVNNRLNYQLLTQTYELMDPGNEKICSIVCFLVHQDYRRRGIMQNMLERIVSDYTEMQYEYIEAYPRSGDLSAEKLYHGPEDFYARNGFDLVLRSESYQTMRRRLSK